MGKLGVSRGCENVLLDALRVHDHVRRCRGPEEGEPEEAEQKRLDDQNGSARQGRAAANLDILAGYRCRRW